MLTLSDRRAAYADEYRKRFAAAKIDPDKVGEVTAIAKRILAAHARYEPISRATGVPWWFIGIAHYREADLDFSKHLHNGDPLTARTRLVPAGRPATGSPPFTFTASAIDALRLKNLDTVKKWDVVETLLRLEQYNGFGYRGQGIPSPYLWAMTNQSNERGKYIADHVFDRNAPDKQTGCVAIMLALRALGVVLFDERPAAAPPPPDVEPPKPAPPAPSSAAAPVAATAIAAAAGAHLSGVNAWAVIGIIALALVAVAVLIYQRRRGAGHPES